MTIRSFTSKDGVTIEVNIPANESSPESIVRDGIEFHRNLVADNPGKNSFQSSAWPFDSYAAGFVEQPGEVERHAAMDRANGILCDYPLDSSGNRRQRFSSKAQRDKWLKANHKIDME